jgi:hypothetical protein
MLGLKIDFYLKDIFMNNCRLCIDICFFVNVIILNLSNIFEC